jgi:ergothioneine biosynthesis protein EgtB
VSPPKWHLAHVSWFFETFLLAPYLKGYTAFHPRFAHLFNSYYESVGTFHARNQRHVLSRPTVEEIYRYRAHVDGHMLGLIEDLGSRRTSAVAQRTVLGLHHEQQHQELLLMDIKRNFLANPLLPAYQDPPETGSSAAIPMRWLEFPGGVHEIGNSGEGFCFDNETPRHRVFLEDYRLASRPVTNAEYLEFMLAGGYEDPRLWLSDGWRISREQGWRAPLYWLETEGAWHEMTLLGCGPPDPASPVCHLSYYEADAYARWRDARLPTEAELETAVAGRPVEGNFADSGLYHPRPARSAEDGQWFGDLWEWSASAYSPYPGFRPLEGSLGEYNGKFMANQFVLRGGCCATPRSHMRATYRNFFYPQDRWPFTGVRLARDAG